MAKYRITSIPQSLPKAQFGSLGVLDNTFKKNPDINMFGSLGVLDNTFKKNPDINIESETLKKIEAERTRLAEEKANRDWEEMLQKRAEAFKKSKKYDKIEPLYTIDSEGFTDEDLTEFQNSGYLPVKDPKTNKINLYPIHEINSRIINNGLRTNEIVNKLGIGDTKLIKSAFGDLMKAADAQYAINVQSKLLDKSLNEGISLEEAVKKLSGKLGTEEGLKKFIKPTNDILNNYINTIKDEINKPVQQELKSMYFDNRDPNAKYSPKIDYNSYDPALSYNMDYYNTTGDWGKFLKDYSDYNKEYKKEYNNSFYNKQNQNVDRLNYLPVSDRTADLKNQLDAINRNIVLGRKVENASIAAADKTINKKYLEQLQADMEKTSDPLVKYELSKKLDAVKNNPKAFSELLKKFETGEVLTKEDEDKISNIAFSLLQKESDPDKIQTGTYRPKLTTKDKVIDVLTNPFDAFKYSNQGGLENMWTSGMGYNERKLLERANPELNLGTQDNLVGNTLNTWNPMRFARDVDSDIDRGDWESVGTEVLKFTSPHIFNQAALAANFARQASAAGFSGAGPGLAFLGSIGESLNPYFAYEALRPGGDFETAYDRFKEGNIGEGLEEAGWGTLGLLGLPSTFRSLKGLRGVETFNSMRNASHARPLNLPKINIPKANLFKVKSLEVPKVKSVYPNKLSFKKGGSLPTYQGPIRSVVKSIGNIGNIGKTALNLRETEQLISKALSESVYKNLLTELQPEKMKLISDLKNEGILSKTLDEGALVNYPNLLDLATKKGIQAKNTVFRSTRPFIGNSNILRSSENTQTELPEEYFNYLKSLPSDVARAAYMSSHISPINVGARTGLDHVIGLNSPMDALYYSRQNINNPNIEYIYGPLQTELRFPFDFSEGDASTWLQKYRDMPFRYKLKDGKTMVNREYAPGVIHNMDIVSDSAPGSEGAILGLRNQRVLEPVRVRYNETYKNLEDEESLHDFMYDIMSKRSPEEQSDYLIHFNNEILPKLDIPKDYFKDTGFTNFGPIESLYDAHNYLWHYNRYLRDLAKKTSNVQVIPYSPFSFGFEKGGAIELELTPKQIKEYIKKGYIIEDI